MHSALASTKTRLSETEPPTAFAAMLLPAPGRPSMNKICGRGMNVSIEVARDHTIPVRRQASINPLSLDYGRTATTARATPPQVVRPALLAPLQAGFLLAARQIVR